MIAKSKQTEVVTIEGKKTKIALSMKGRVPLQMWYFLQHPCGGWVEFDIRDIAALKGWTSEAEFDTLCGTIGILPILARKIEAENLLFSQFFNSSIATKP